MGVGGWITVRRVMSMLIFLDALGWLGWDLCTRVVLFTRAAKRLESRVATMPYLY